MLMFFGVYPGFFFKFTIWVFPEIVVPLKTSILIGFSMIFTIHFGFFSSYFWKHPYISPSFPSFASPAPPCSHERRPSPDHQALSLGCSYDLGKITGGDFPKLHTKQDRRSSCFGWSLVYDKSYDRILYMIYRCFTMFVNVLTAEIILVILFGWF